MLPSLAHRSTKVLGSAAGVARCSSTSDLSGTNVFGRATDVVRNGKLESSLASCKSSPTILKVSARWAEFRSPCSVSMAGISILAPPSTNVARSSPSVVSRSRFFGDEAAGPAPSSHDAPIATCAHMET